MGREATAPSSRRGALFARYLPLADEWVMYDNSLTDAEAIASSTTGRVEVHSPSVFETIRRLAES